MTPCWDYLLITVFLSRCLWRTYVPWSIHFSFDSVIHLIFFRQPQSIYMTATCWVAMLSFLLLLLFSYDCDYFHLLLFAHCHITLSLRFFVCVCACLPLNDGLSSGYCPAAVLSLCRGHCLPLLPRNFCRASFTFGWCVSAQAVSRCQLYMLSFYTYIASFCLRFVQMRCLRDWPPVSTLMIPLCFSLMLSISLPLFTHLSQYQLASSIHCIVQEAQCFATFLSLFLACGDLNTHLSRNNNCLVRFILVIGSKCFFFYCMTSYKWSQRHHSFSSCLHC